MAGSRPRAGRWRRLAGVGLALIGFVLSPLSWWNDALVNIPLAYLLAWPVARVAPQLFLPALLVGYWITNLIGLWLLHSGAARALPQQVRPDLRRDLLIGCGYTLLIALLAWLGWLPLPGPPAA